MATRLTRVVGEYQRGVLSQDGLNYRHERQEMSPVIDHVKFLNDKVNDAPRVGNRNDWHYVGSIPWTIAQEFLKKELPEHLWPFMWERLARNTDGIKDRLRDWFLGNRDLKKFHAIKKREHSVLFTPGGQ